MKIEEIFLGLQEGLLSTQDAETKLRNILGEKQLQANIALPIDQTKKQLNSATLPSGNLLKPIVELHEIEQDIVQVTMQDRINKNTFTPELVKGLENAFTLIEDSTKYKVVILTGYDNYFATGGTKEALLAIYDGKIKFSDSDFYRFPLDCKLPVIAAMQGHGIGAGLSMGMFCDFIVLCKDSVYTSNYMKYGFTPGAGATLIFPEKCGQNLAQEILFTGKKYRGSELAEKGIAFPVMQRDKVLPYAIELSKDLANSTRNALIALKERMSQDIRNKLSNAVEKELKMHEKTFVKQPEVKKRIDALYNPIFQNAKPTIELISSQNGKDKASEDCDYLSIAAIEVSEKKRKQSGQNGIAVIGMSGQFPKAKNLNEFWKNIANGKDCITEIDKARWPIDRYYNPDNELPGKTNSKWMGKLDDIDKFDPLFFNISPIEAEIMDPQQRLFLESCWHCIEDAGINGNTLSGSRCGVFAGCAMNEYGAQHLEGQSLMGRAISVLSARIAYLLNLNGPCLAIDTACSSSLVAIAEACNSLMLHSSDLALAGGVCALPGPSMHIMCSKAGMLSKDGRCFTFDNRANGFVPGEGVGVILLKRLSDAIRDRDPIYGVIRGWGINQDGKTNGITAPSVNSQITLEKEVYHRFNINPETISLVEAHGTGTKLGDPIEVDALVDAFQAFTNKKNYCALGSVKSNVGHLLTAAGIAGTIKVLLAMKHRMMPPTINYERINEHISLDNSPFYINTELKSWENHSNKPRCSCVNSFGFSGTNAHIVIEEYYPEPASENKQICINSTSPVLFLLSAKNPEQLFNYAKTMKNWIESHKNIDLADLAYTLQVGRKVMNYRLAFVAHSKEDLQSTLGTFIDDGAAESVLTNLDRNEIGKVDIEKNKKEKILLQTLAQNKNLKKAAELWVRGLEINWNQFYGNNKPRRINMPGYPFAKERYWLAENNQELFSSSTDALFSKKMHPLYIKESTKVCELHQKSMLSPVWSTVAVEKGGRLPRLPNKTEKILIINGTEENTKSIKQFFPKVSVLDIKSGDTINVLFDKLKKIDPIHHIFFITNHNSIESLSSERILTAQKKGVILCFRLIKALLRLKYGTKKLGWTVVTVKTQTVHNNEIINPTHAGLHGLIGSMAKEYPNWYVRIVDIEDHRKLPLLQILDLPADDQGNAWAYREGEWYRQKIVVVRPDKTRASLYKQGGVYVVIGGAGGLGEAWTDYMLRTYRANVIWLGRRTKDSDIRTKLNSLAVFGLKPYYIKADATKELDLQNAYNKIKERFSEINGVIHSAVGVIDQSLANMKEEQFMAGLAAKVDVNVRIAQVFGNEKLDFVLFFSSMATFGKSIGQSSYTAGCNFKDAFARRLANEWPCTVKVMNWGYWGNIGIGGKISDALKNRIMQAGLGDIEPAEAMQALEVHLAGPLVQLGYIKPAKSLVIDGFDKKEFVAVNPKTISSNIKSIMNLKIAPYSKQKNKKIIKKYMNEMEELLCKILIGQLQSINAFTGKGKIIKFYEQWMEESCKMLELKKHIRFNKENSSIITTAPIDLADVWKDWEIKKISWLQNADMKGRVPLIEETMINLPQILTGKNKATDVIFAKSSLKLVEGIYKNNSTADYFNEALADSLIAYVKERIRKDKSVKIRIMELGAGTGGTSVAVFNKLAQYQEYIQEYCYTDISKAFLMHAKTEYGPWNPYLKYKIFDVEYPVAGQGVSAGKYDVIIAANVLHATKNIRQTLRNTKALLRSNGVVLINEAITISLYSHLTFGLLKGWWLYEDPAVRISGSPILSAKKWKHIMEQEGLNSVSFPAESEKILGQQIIAAESDGIIRQRYQNQHDKENIQDKNEIKIPIEHKISAKSKSTESNHDLLKEKSTAYLQKVIGKTLKIPVNKIDSSETFENYGIDSILVGQLNNVLSENFKDISSTLFYEYQSIDELVEHFMEKQRNSLIKLFDMEQKEIKEKKLFDEKSTKNETGKYINTLDNNTRQVVQIDSRKYAENEEKAEKEPIAIIGMSGRYPQAQTMDEYWRNLSEGKDCITEIPKARWSVDRFFNQDKKDAVANGKSYCKWGGFLDGFANFDPLFFHIAPQEAINIDPQERLLIESCWEVLEDAGYTRKKLAQQHGNRIGVFTGITRTGFDLFGPDLWKQEQSLFPHTSFGSAANRISYIMNFQGPSMPIDTMCSSSLTAIHEACEHIYRGECEVAIAGGVNLYLHPSSYTLLCRLHMLSTDGKCKSFGKGANGFVPGEGVGCLMLKPLSRAMADHDHIYAIIRGSSINHSGKTNGYTVPTPKAQGAVIRNALEKAGVNARTISYIEAHGTGTELGDPIEIEGLLKAFAEDTQDTGFCSIGSVKSNIGHLEAAAGMASVSKVILQMKNVKIVPSLHAKEMNTNIDFEKTPFKVQQELETWKRPVIKIEGIEKEWPRIAGISSFGAGGTNAHIVLEEYVPDQMDDEIKKENRQKKAIIVLSAKSEEQLRKQVKRLLAALIKKEYTDAELDNIAYTLQTGREEMEVRLGLIVKSIKELKEKLSEYTAKKIDISGLYCGQVKQNKEVLDILKADKEFQEFIVKWIKGEKYEKLVNLWVKGISLDWDKLYDGTLPYRISLPTYPFEKELLWFKKSYQNASETSQTKVVKTENYYNSSTQENTTKLSEQQYNSTCTDCEQANCQEPFKVMTFAEKWREQNLTKEDSIQLKNIICFVTNSEMQKKVSKTMQNIDPSANIIFISVDENCGKNSALRYSILQNEPDEYIDVFRSISKNYEKIDALIYLNALEDSRTIGYYDDIVYILQAVIEVKLKIERILLVAQFENEIERCYMESWIGFERSIGFVLPYTQVASVFQSANEVDKDTKIESWLQKCNAELKTGKIESALYKDGKRFVQKVQSTVLNPRKSQLKTGGTYLITGGCGGIGSIFTEYLCKKHNANLILTGRSALNEEKQEKIKALNVDGSKIIYLQADVCDLSSMREGLKQAKILLGDINGVIHAAGVYENLNINEKTLKSFKKILKPKINGTRVLDELIESEPLDFICYFSSSSAILGDSGSCDYSIGNRFLMAYVNYRNGRLNQGKKTGKAFVINWPLWKGGRMRLEHEQSKMYLKSSGQRILKAKEGLSMFESVLSQADTQHLVIVGQATRVERFLGFEKDSGERAVLEFKNSGKGKFLENNESHIDQRIEIDLKKHIGQLLNISHEKLDIDTNLADFGFDSISLANFAEVLGNLYKIEITPALFFSHTNIRKLIKYFLIEHKELMERFYLINRTDTQTSEKAIENTVTLSELKTGKLETIKKDVDVRVPEPIAVIGMSGRFPQARNINEMWNILEKGKNVIQDFINDRYTGRRKGTTNYKCGYIQGVSEFDPSFFDISPREAMSMDPRQRLLLQETWKALEDAGYGKTQTKNKIGMFVGAEESEYGKLLKDKGSITSNSSAILASRLAYFLNFKGPVMTINTACSSGLVAAHQACISLRSRECDTAIAAGVALLLTSEIFDAMSHAGMLSENGTLYAFDNRANGVVPGEAVVAVVLKRLSQAESDGDPIYAVIQGSGINYDGKTNGITAPSLVSQTELLKSVYKQNKINPENIEYVVTHGTGTKLGDSVEINALYDAFNKFSDRKRYCALTSSKTNYGHTLAASGLVSLVSLIQAFKHEVIPASLNCEQENEYFKWDKSPFYVNKNNNKWPKNHEKPQVGAISAFGMSGTNVHMVLQNYNSEKTAINHHKAPYYLIILSAKTKKALQEKINDMRKEFENKMRTEEELPGISYTLMERRQHFDYRFAMVIWNIEEAKTLLGSIKNVEDGRKIPKLFYGKVSKDTTRRRKQNEHSLFKKVQSKERDIKKYKNILNIAADLYCKGYDPRWNQIFEDSRPEIIRLPTYPFAKDKYWVPDSMPDYEGNAAANHKKTLQIKHLKPTGCTELNEQNATSWNQSDNTKQIRLEPLTGNKKVKSNVILIKDKKHISQDNKKTVIENQNQQETKNIIVKELIDSLAGILYIKRDEVDISKQFIEMGMDSIIGVEWSKVLNKRYGIPIAATKIYDYPTVHEFAEYLNKELIKQKGNTKSQAANKLNIKEERNHKLPENRVCNDPPEITEKLVKELTKSLADILYIKQKDVDISKQFIDLGMDSIIGVEWSKVLNKRFGISIAATKIYDYPTIREFAIFLKEEIEKQNNNSERKSSNNYSAAEEIKYDLPLSKNNKDDISNADNKHDTSKKKFTNLNLTNGINPEDLGNEVFKKRYGTKLNYYAGSMYRGISSVELVSTMGKSNILSFFGSAGFSVEELELHIQSIQSRLDKDKPYGMCMMYNMKNPHEEMNMAKLFIRYNIPVIEAAAYFDLSEAIVYLRVKGIRQQDGKINPQRRIIAKFSRLEVARLFLAPPPMHLIEKLLKSGMINEEEGKLSQYIPMADDLAVESDSGGHTDQGVAFALIPTVISLKNEMIQKYKYQEDVLIGCGGGIGTPEAVCSAFMLGADYIFTGSINQCTVESGANDVVKNILNKISVHDTAVTISGDMFEIGGKVQVVKKESQFSVRAKRLHQLFRQYNALEEIPQDIKKEIETLYFKNTLEQVWKLVCEYKRKKNAEQIQRAENNARLKMTLIFKWYFARCNHVTLSGDENEKDNYQIFCGPALGAFNQWVQGTPYELWQNRHVDKIAEYLMIKACNYIQTRRLKTNRIPILTKSVGANPVKKISVHTQKKLPFDNDSSIAIIGIAGQFPKANNLAEYWKNIASGKNCISEVPKSRWDLEKYYDKDLKAAGKTNSKWMGVLEDADKFDPLFFNISPAEAELMDPQQRVFLENCWHCIEDAGLSPDALSGSRCGVFVGGGTSTYGQSTSIRNLSAQGLLGGATSILSARISYLLNLKGPCLAIETACSSSLVAIAQACNSILLGNSDFALAGGVHVMHGPKMHIMTSKSGMLSINGRCFTFDNRANGFVPGEGVGVILLKRLADAVSDQDTIYGVISGWGINQDGKTNGITSPSANSQAQLEKDVYSRFNINPETISLVEAHGTGTKLGDPIEVEALTKAFSTFTEKKKYCALGSVKSNIGHLFPAAGVAGLIKVLLALKHKMLPPTINYETLNEHISLNNSPFYINAKLQPWKNVSVVPRRACVSSFGFSGTNAHIVVEEYLPQRGTSKTAIRMNKNYPIIFVLSAKNEEQLEIYALKIMEWLASKKNYELSDIAYTLQTGREAMECRLAFVANSRSALNNILAGFINKNAPSELLTAQIKSKDLVAVIEPNEDEKTLLKKYVQERNLTEIAKFWLKGFNIEWSQLYMNIQPRRINLPTYPFVRSSYWLPENTQKSTGNKKDETSVKTINTLIKENLSDINKQRFSSVFTGEEFFLRDHIINRQMVLPAVTYLEMVREAVMQNTKLLTEGEKGIRLSNHVWSSPVVVKSKPISVYTELYTENPYMIGYKINSNLEGGADAVVHSQGHATVFDIKEIPTLDIESLKTECVLKNVSSSKCYEAFDSVGIDYGPSHRGIESLHVGAGKVLAKLKIPVSVEDTQNKYVLHPCIMDSALQASIGLIFNSGVDLQNKTGSNPALPYALEELEVYSRCLISMWAIIRIREDDRASVNMPSKLDIDLCDKKGNVCVRMKGFSSRVLDGEFEQEESKIKLGTLLLEPSWYEKNVETNDKINEYSNHLVILCEPEEFDKKNIEAKIDGAKCLALQSRQGDIGERYQSYAGQILAEIRNILNYKPKGKILIQVVVSAQEKKYPFTGISGLLKTIQLENPNVCGQLIEIGTEETTNKIIDKLKDNSRRPIDNKIRYKDNKRYVAGWREIEIFQKNESIPWRDRGVYLITGGAGGLGSIFTKEIVLKVRDVTLILTGRSQIDEDRQSKLKKLETMGSRIIYKQLNVNKKLAVTDFIRNIQEDYGNLNGIIHSAGVIKDNFVIKKNDKEIQEVLTPKVTGLVNLDQASKNLQLDLFILFSSGAGALGNIGQADYAAANAFMDAYACYRNKLVALGQRFGQTLSINWPLWKDGGMQISAEKEQMIRKNTGSVALQTIPGIQALYNSIATGKDQILVLSGEVNKMKEMLLEQLKRIKNTETQDIKVKNPEVPAADKNMLKERTIDYFKRIISEVIKHPAHMIEADAPLINYGIDSLMVMQLNNQLEDTFKSLSKTIFFEYQNIEELAGYFLESYREELIKMFGIQESYNLNISNNKDLVIDLESKRKKSGNGDEKRYFPIQVENRTVNQRGSMDIAIIGMSGRFPQARNIQEFWHILKSGKDCITEIPKDRWNLDHTQQFNKSRNKNGKTYGKWGGFIDGVDEFDPLFFNISMREAEIMAPQERLFLQCVYETIEDAGYTSEGLSVYQTNVFNRNVGVFVGVMYEEYPLWGVQEQLKGNSVAIAGDPSTIANRVSYFLNLNGPSMTISTMCSSSMTAIHMACQNIQQGECDLAIAGGVNLSIHPNKYLALGHGSFLSSNGRCTSFGKGGDGYVPGEAVGALLLKPLSKAIDDKDHIDGIIKATAINHGGRTNGYTVPNPNAQANVIGNAVKKAGIDPRAISYVEAHGTGTDLGDPIEISGLNKIFSEYSKDKQFCTIGSVKSNIGHCESAAGIVGVMKVLLQLKHRKLVPSLHSANLNPNIDFRNSPFIVQQELAEWKRPVIQNDDGKTEYPRIAGISSFGAGGANAHVIIEEYISQETNEDQVATTTQNSAMVILSAKNEELLVEQARQLLSAIRKKQLPDINLSEIAYTLQVGREAMNDRLGLIVKSIKELEKKLDKFVSGQKTVENLYRGQVERNNRTMGVLAMDEDMSKTIDTWITKRKYTKILSLWVKGLDVDWNRFYGIRPNRVSLPTYPFAREHYWVPNIRTNTDNGNEGAAITTIAPIHVLLQQNTSCFSEQRYSSTFTGREFFLKDYVVDGQRILPAMAYIEMVRAGIEQSVRTKDSLMGLRIKNVIWAKPVIVGEKPIQVHLGLYAGDKNEIGYKIYSENVQIGAKELVHSQGTVLLGETRKIPFLEINALQDRCSQNVFSSEKCYELFKQVGIDYGPGYQTIKKLYTGKTEVLAKLYLPVNIHETQAQFVLHPSLMDSALQASMGLVMSVRDLSSDNAKEHMKPMLPFALSELEILGPCTRTMWALVKLNDRTFRRNKVQKLDVDLCDEQGNISVRMRGLSFGKVQDSELTEGLNQPKKKIMDQSNDTDSNTVKDSSEVSNKGNSEKRRNSLRETAINYCKKMISSVTKIPVQRIKTNDLILNYGIDSIMMLQITDKLENTFGTLSKTLLIEYQDIGALTDYFIECHRDQLIELLDYGKSDLSSSAQEIVLQNKTDNPSGKNIGLEKKTFNGHMGSLMPVSYDELSAEAEELSDKVMEKMKKIPEEHYRIERFSHYIGLSDQTERFARLEIQNPYFRPNDSIINNKALIDKREYISYSSYNYLGFSGDERVTRAANEASELYGTSVSASRVVTGEKPIHGELEKELAEILGTEDCIVFNSGHLTNVSTISCLLGSKDLVIHDDLGHNSIVMGCILSGARRIIFPHNDWKALDTILKENRENYERTMIIAEGVYSMDGDKADLPRLIELKKRYKTLLMVDEAHSIGVLGKNGRGIGEYYGIDPQDVDVWMGTLSKTFASCGGYIAGSNELIRLSKYYSEGFVYSCGIPPANAGAALAAARLLRTETNRVEKLQKNARFFLELAKENKLDTGLSKDTAIVPVIVRDSEKTFKLANELFLNRINVHPIVHPAVPKNEDRLRFFITSDHSEDQMIYTTTAIRESLKKL